MALGALDIIIAADTAQLRKGMDEAVGIMKSSTKTMETAAKTAAGAIAGYFALDSIKGSIQHTIDFADSLGKMSQKIGVSVDSLYAMQAAGKLADVNLETLEKSLLKFNKGLGSASMGSGDTANALKNLGISLKDSSGHMKMSDQYLLEVADKFKAMPDGIGKSTLAMQLFGKSGADMIPLLNGGSEALTEFSGIMDEQTSKSAEKFNDSLTTVGLAVDAVWMQMASNLSPTLSAIADDFTSVAKEGKDTGKTLGDDLAQGMKVAINLGYIVAGSFSMAGHALGNLGAAASLMAEGDFSGAKFAWNKISEDAKKDEAYWDARIKKVMSATAESQKESDTQRANASQALEDFQANEAKKEAAIKKAEAERKKREDEIKKAAKALEDQKKADDKYAFDEAVKQHQEKKRLAKELLEDQAEREAKSAIAAYELNLDLSDKTKQLTLSEYEYNIDKLNEQFKAYSLITDDKVALEKWFNATKNKLDKDHFEKQAEEAKKTFEEQNKFWVDLLGNINKAMDDQFFNAMTGKFESFGSWLKDFWGAMTNSLARGLSKSLADAMIDTGAGGIQNIFKTFGGLGSVFGSAATPAALLGASTDSSGFTTTAGGTVFDSAGQITLGGSDATEVLSALSNAKSLYSLATDGITGMLYAPSAFMGNLAGMAYGAGFTGTGSFLAGGANILAGGGVSGLSGAAYAGGLATAGIAGGLGGYAMGSIGDKLLGADTRAGTYGAIGGSIGAIAGSIIPGLGTLVGGAIGSALGSLIGGAFGKTKQTGSGIQAWGDISTQSGAGSVQSYADFKKKSWFKSSSWTNYYGLTEKERKGIEGVFQTYDYLLGQLGDLDTIVVSAGRYSGTSFYNAIDKSFIRAFIDNPELTDTFYTAWTEYALEIGKAVQETFATMVSGYVDYTRNYKTWMLESSGNTLESLRLKAEWAQGDLNAYSNLIGVSGVTVENYLDMYSQAIKTTFTPEAINNWQKLGDALKNSTELTKSYTDALKEQTTYIPTDMMLQKTGATKTAVDIKQLVNQQGAQTEQTAQLVAVLTETVKVLKKQLSIAQLGNNQGLPA